MVRVYLDHNATTPLRPEARAELLKQLDALGANPSSVHGSGRAARAVLDDARARVAAALGVHEDEIVFTSGGTESIHLALTGVLGRRGGARALVTTSIEHSAVLETARALESAGHRISRAEVDSEGRIDADELVRAAREPDVALVSLMSANNEVGTLLPVERVAQELRRGAGGRARGPGSAATAPLVHTDAVQALGRVPLRLREWGIDLASLSAHKVGGPLGVGVLYRRAGVELAPALHGGGQESGLRPGTENVPAIAAAATAIELAIGELESSRARWTRQSRELWLAIARALPNARLNGPPIDAADRLSNTLNVSFAATDGRTLVARLDLEGLELSAGSACASGSIEPSHVLLAMGRSKEDARAAVRMSLGRATRDEDVHTSVEILRRVLCVSQQVSAVTQACEGDVKSLPPAR